MDRDHQDIFDIGLRDHFFRVQLFPKTFPCDWEVLGVRLQRKFQVRLKMSELRRDIDTHLLERTFLKERIRLTSYQNRGLLKGQNSHISDIGLSGLMKSFLNFRSTRPTKTNALDLFFEDSHAQAACNSPKRPFQTPEVYSNKNQEYISTPARTFTTLWYNASRDSSFW